MKKLALLSMILLFGSILYIISEKSDDSIIVESNQLSTIINYINSPDTLVIFDIDNTLAHPTQELGSDEWFCFLVDKKMSEGFDRLTAVYYALPKIFYAQFNIPLKPTEDGISELISQLASNNIAIMALTARSIFIAERTIEQLHNIDIAFFMSGISNDDLVLPMQHPSFYKEGVLFSGDNDKGETLQYFLNFMNYHPQKIIFIDDKMKCIESVKKGAQKLNIPFVGIRYSYCDERVKQFDPAKAEKQWYELLQQNRITSAI
ncbi:MAG TPA: DUF2608 domain-containing protein [Candidatus Babeliales bacterium]|nr:DUF2608 domain-containing protein [Candidatus Babeliales bacterium]